MDKSSFTVNVKGAIWDGLQIMDNYIEVWCLPALKRKREMERQKKRERETERWREGEEEGERQRLCTLCIIHEYQPAAAVWYPLHLSEPVSWIQSLTSCFLSSEAGLSDLYSTALWQYCLYSLLQPFHKPSSTFYFISNANYMPNSVR